MTPPPTFPKRFGNLSNLSREAWQYYKRGLVRLPKGLGSKGCCAISYRKIRCPKRLGKITEEAWQDYRRGLARLPKRLGNITKEAWTDYQNDSKIEHKMVPNLSPGNDP